MARRNPRPPQQEPALGSRLVIGAIAGFVATLAMTSAMRRLHKPLPPSERYPLSPRGVAGSKAASGGSGASGTVDATIDPPRRAAPDLTLVAHFAYGAACGALLAALSERPGRAGGTLAGAAVWLTSYMGWIPAFGVLKPATEHPLRRNAAMLAAHLSWGWSTAEAIRELSAARATIFAEGPLRDVPAGRCRAD